MFKDYIIGRSGVRYSTRNYFILHGVIRAYRDTKQAHSLSQKGYAFNSIYPCVDWVADYATSTQYCYGFHQAQKQSKGRIKG